VEVFDNFIEMVQPFDIILSTVSSPCAFTPGGLIPQIRGGFPFKPGQLDPDFFSYPGSSIVRQSQYKTFWRTPLTGGQFVETVLPLQAIPGFYEIIAQDANKCNGTASATVTSPPPIEVEIVDFNAVCQDSTLGEVRLRITGGVPPYTTLQNLTVIQIGQDLSFEFVASFNQTAFFHVLDSVGCLLPSALSFTIPDPGAFNITTKVEDSCANIATGRVEVMPVEQVVGVTCMWQSDGVEVPGLQTCVLENIPGGSFVRVFATDITGCTAVATVEVPARPPIVITELERTTNGTFGENCTDIIRFHLMGGLSGPPFAVTLFDDMTNATLVYNGTSSANITGVCRSIQYILTVRDLDGLCPTAFVSTDPEFGFGSIGDDFPVGIPPPGGDSVFGSGRGGENKNRIAEEVGIIMGVILALVVLVGIIFAALYKSPEARRKPSRNTYGPAVDYDPFMIPGPR
jgi:hypothetical protein